MYVYCNLYVYFSREFSLPLVIEMYGWPLFTSHPYIESNTILSDNNIYIL